MDHIAQISNALYSTTAKRAPEGGRIAAVAMVFSPRLDGAMELLMIRRASAPDDPWSGHMAFPGGHQDPEDDTPLDTALRETQEEINLVQVR